MTKKVQFIGYSINTGPHTLQNDKAIYLGLDDPIADYKARVELLKQAIEKAASDNSIDKQAVKIFTVPEFYFRGHLGAYDLATIMGVPGGDTGLISALQNLVKDKKWRNWLFVIGSIIGWSATAKEKSVLVSDIVIPTFKPKGKNGNDTVNKPVDKSGCTVEEALRISVFEYEFKQAFNSDNRFNTNPDRDNLALKYAKDIVDKTPISDVAVNSIINASGNKLKNDRFASVTNDAKCIELKELVNFSWSAATDQSKVKEAYNLCPIIVGGFGTAKAADNTYMTMKRQKSSIDFVKLNKVDSDEYNLYGRGSLLVDLNDDLLVDVQGGDNDPRVIHAKTWKLIEANGKIDSTTIEKLKKEKDYAVPVSDKDFYWFTAKPENDDPLGFIKVNNLNIAVDVCLDHLSKISKKTLHALTDNNVQPVLSKIVPSNSESLLKEIKGKGVDIQIVPSCGMDIKSNSIVAKTGGWVFNCDGLQSKRYLYQPFVGEANSAVFVDYEPSGALKELLGYQTSAKNTDKSVGNSHTGLMYVDTAKLDPTESSTLTAYNTKGVTVKNINLGVSEVANGNPMNSRIKVNALYTSGSNTLYNAFKMPAVRPGVATSVSFDGPIGGSVHIYSSVDIS